MIKFVSDLTTGRWFSLGTSVSSTNETDHHNITEILLKVALHIITLPPTQTGLGSMDTLVYVTLHCHTYLNYELILYYFTYLLYKCVNYL